MLGKETIKKIEEIVQIAHAAKWDRKFINNLPDVAFAVLEKWSGSRKDNEGKTVPRNLRALPHHSVNVKTGTENTTVDLPHLRAAMARLNQVKPTKDEDSAGRMQNVAKTHLFKHAKKLLPNFDPKRFE